MCEFSIPGPGQSARGADASLWSPREPEFEAAARPAHDIDRRASCPHSIHFPPARHYHFRPRAVNGSGGPAHGTGGPPGRLAGPRPAVRRNEPPPDAERGCFGAFRDDLPGRRGGPVPARAPPPAGPRCRTCIGGWRHAGGGRGIARQGEDGRPVSGRRLPRARDARPCQRPAGEGRLGEGRPRASP